MSKARAIILSVTVEGLSQAETARRYQVSKGWVSKLIDRHRTHGEEALQPRSRRPHSSPTRVADVLAELIVNLRIQLVADGLDAGPETIRWHLEQHHDVTVSTSTIRRRLLNAGLITPEPKKRPRSSYIRFTADLPNECWQSDFTHWRLADGTDTEILTWLDDHSRYALSVTAHQPVTGTTVVATFDEILATHGVPASVLTATPSSTPPASPADEADATTSRPTSQTSASTKSTPPRTTPPPAERSNASNRP